MNLDLSKYADLSPKELAKLGAKSNFEESNNILLRLILRELQEINANPVVEEKAVEVDYNALKKQAKELGLEFANNIKKPELLELIQAKLKEAK